MNFAVLFKLRFPMFCVMLAILAVTGCRTFNREAELQFKPSFGGWYQGTLTNIGPVLATPGANDEEFWLTVSTSTNISSWPDLPSYIRAPNGINDDSAPFIWVLKGKKDNGTLELYGPYVAYENGKILQPPLKMSCRMTDNAFTGVFAADINCTNNISFTLQRTTSELEFAPLPLGLLIHDRGARMQFLAQIPVLKDTTFGKEIEQWMRDWVLGQYHADKKQWNPGFVYWINAWLDGGYHWVYERDCDWMIFHQDQDWVSLLCHDTIGSGWDGRTHIHTANFIWRNGEMQNIKLGDFFKDENWQESLMNLIMTDLKRQGEDWPDGWPYRVRVEAAITNETCVYDNEGMLFQFSEYSKMAGQVVTYESKIFWKDIQPLLWGYRVNQLPEIHRQGKVQEAERSGQAGFHKL